MTFRSFYLMIYLIDEGKIVVGDTVEIGYYTQKGMKMDEGKRVIEIVRDIAEYIPLVGGRKMTAVQLLERFLFSKDAQWKHVSVLSGGEKKRLYLLTILMKNPNFLILDEPTTALDVTVEAAVVDLVKDLGKKYGTSMLFISHNLGLILETCDQICVMYSGEAVDTGSISDVFDKMQHPYTQALFRSIPLPGADKNSRPLVAIPGNFPLPHERPNGCNFGPRCNYFKDGICNTQAISMNKIKGFDRHFSRCSRIEEINWDTPISSSSQFESLPPGDVVLKIDNLKKYYEVAANALFGSSGTYKTVKANETLSFEARESETLAIVSESGCGKSTFAKVLMGLETATNGSILLDNENIGSTPIEARDTQTVADIQMVFQNPFDTLNP